MSLTLIQGASFVSTGVGKTIILPGSADYFRTINLTQAATTQATGRGISFEWFADRTAQDGAVMYSKTNSTNALNMSVITSGGFTYTVGIPSTGPALTGTTISQAGSAVCSVTNTYSNGDRVRIYGVVGMRQISTMDFTISSVSGSAFTLSGLDSSGFASAGTAFQVRKIPASQTVLPEYLFVTNITQAANAVVKVSTLHDYVAGMKVRVDLPSTYGMTQINGLSGTILSVTDYTLTLDIDSSGFTAFAFPTTAASVNLVRFATLAPDGQKAYYDVATATQYGYNVTEAPFRSVYQQPSIFLAAGVLSPAGSNSDVIEYQAFKYGN